MKTHCIHGHEYTPENTRIHHGRRECWVCVRARDAARRTPEFWREYRAKRKAEGRPIQHLIPIELHKKRGPIAMTAEERFTRNVGEPDVNGCRPWLGAKGSNGYGQLDVEYMGGTKYRRVMAHRFAWEREHGPIPEGMQIDHVWPVCQRRDCVESSHLEPVTGSENVLRAKRKTAKPLSRH